MVDLDNDGFKDIFVANGIYQDLTDQDFINFIADSDVMTSMVKENKVDYRKLIDAIPSEPIPNHFFKNINGENFEDQTVEYGFEIPSHSNGSAYGDLDLDGDLDLVVNNVNMPAFIYRNNSSEINHYAQVKLKYKKGNEEGVGSKVAVYTNGIRQLVEYMPMKGFQSSMDHLIHFGLGKYQVIDSMSIVWPDMKRTLIENPAIDSLLTIDYAQVEKAPIKIKALQNSDLLFERIDNIEIKHHESEYIDFDRDRLLFHMTSTLGPDIEVADLNSDGLDDIVFCQGKGKVSQLFYQEANGKFVDANILSASNDKGNEDIKCKVFDANGDNLNDVFFLSCSSELSQESADIKDRLYLQNADGNFDLFNKALGVSKYQNSSAIDNYDFDNDGDQDIIIAERLKASQYGVPCSVNILRNDGDKGFVNITKEAAPELLHKGMYSDVKFADVNNDNLVDIICGGQYMALSVLLNNGNNKWSLQSNYFNVPVKGWWNTIEVVDINNDNLPDIIAGNHGLNSRFKADGEHPLCLHVNDFDGNGSIEQILCRFEGEKSYPLALRHDIFKQLPHLKKKYIKYENYANQTIEDIFSEEERQNMLSLTANNMETCIFLNTGKSFEKVDLPKEVQYAPIYAILVDDFNKDGIADILLGGNLYGVKPEVGRYDASQGTLLLGNGKGSFDLLPNHESGFAVEGEIRDMESIKIDEQDYVIIARNNDTSVLYQLRND